MFSKMKNIDTAFRQMRLFCILFLIGCTAITLFVVYRSSNIVSRSQQKIFVISNGKALEAYAVNRKDNIGVEARDHVGNFHRYFFMLDPDEKVIQSNLTKALYLADESARRQYNDLKENGYYSNIISANISQTITIDSIGIDLNQYPYFFTCRATQQIIRSTAITQRSLLTEGYLRDVSRSDNNPHGFLIERWRVLDNRDISTQNRQQISH
ncbi:MAG: conjugative transposon protein TraK [Hymenobacter sp.]|nr:MAG: conjugative transposon protein TraK [Hymenobacter sp.]